MWRARTVCDRSIRVQLMSEEPVCDKSIHAQLMCEEPVCEKSIRAQLLCEEPVWGVNTTIMQGANMWGVNIRGNWMDNGTELLLDEYSLGTGNR